MVLEGVVNDWFDKDPNRALRNENALWLKTQLSANFLSHLAPVLLTCPLAICPPGKEHFRRIIQDDIAMLPWIWVLVDKVCDFVDGHSL